MKERQKNSAVKICTFIHNFAQSLRTISVDGEMRCEYLARQIEPGSLRTSTGQFKRLSKLQSKLSRELDREARSFTSSLEKAQPAER